MNPAPDQSPDSFGPYEVYERLGIGGMATVHRAKKRGIEGFERSVALKRMLQHLAEDGNFVDSFIREAKVASLLQHPNIAQVYDFGRYGGVYYIAMELVTGFDIRKLLRYASKIGEPIPMPVILSILGELADALEYAHTFVDETGTPLNIVHRDISPSNLIIAHTGHLKVIDFGIAKASSRQLQTESGQVKGKLGYMSPEAALGMTLDTVSDIFSMGVVAWELVTASPLFSAKTDYETMRRIREAPIAPPSLHNPACPPELDSIICSSLEREPTRRLPSAAVFRAAIDALATQHGIHHSARHVAEWMARFTQPGDAWMRGPTQRQLPQSTPQEQSTAVLRPKSASGAGLRLRRSAEQAALAGEIWGDDVPATAAGPDFSVPVSRPMQAPPVQLPLAAPAQSTPSNQYPHPMQLVQMPQYTPTQHPPPATNKKPIVLLALLLVVAGVLGGVLVIKKLKRAPSSAPAPTAVAVTPIIKNTVRFLVEPPDATIEIAGSPASKESPFETELDQGVYTVVVRKDGYKQWSGSITVRAGESQTVNVVLEPLPPPVAVTEPVKPAEPVEKTKPGKDRDKKKPQVATVKPKDKDPEPVKPEPPPEPPPQPIKPPEPPPDPDPPPVKPDKPARPIGVAANAVTKISGEIPAIKSADASNADVTVKMCIDETGKVSSAKVVKSTVASIKPEVERALSSWRYKPYLNKDKDPSAACFLLPLRLVFKRAG